MKKFWYAFALCALITIQGCKKTPDEPPEPDFIPVAAVTLNRSATVLAEGGTVQLIASIAPDNATDQTVTWSSADAAIATVDGEGLVTAVAVGKTAITATAGGQTASCYVSVKEAPPAVVEVTGIVIDQAPAIHISEGETQYLTATVTPDNATDKTVIWSSADPTLATVSGNGAVLGIKEGETTVTAKAGSCESTCTIIISQVQVTSMTPDVTYLRMITGETQTVHIAIYPENAVQKDFECSSSDNSVATAETRAYTYNGQVTSRYCEVRAVGYGTAVITATNLLNGCNTSFTVKVVAPEPKFVDIGLSVKWADRNLGANTATDAGIFFAWGEVEPKQAYTSATYKWFDGYNLTKYKTKGSILDMEDDAASVILGEGFRIPTCEEIDELLATIGDEDNYESYWDEQDGVKGWYIEYRENHNSIFIPAVGARQGNASFRSDVLYLWSNQTDNSNASKGTLLRAEQPASKLNANKASLLKEYGVPIRPVSSK